MEKLNNVNLENLRNFEEKIKKEPAQARKTQILEGEWLFENEEGQFQSKIKFEGGEVLFKSDNPTFLGGEGKLPGPMQYCFFGLVSCYTGIFANVASRMGLKLKKISTKVEVDINFSKVFNLADLPIMEEVRIYLSVESDEPEEKIKEAERQAIERCPAVYTLKNPVKLVSKLEIKK